MAKDGAWLQQLAQERLIALSREMPPATAEILEREIAGLPRGRRAVPRRQNARRPGPDAGRLRGVVRPAARRTTPSQLARAEPVEIDLGGGLTFRIAGRIDRIDKVGPRRFEVIDYKTGGFWRDDWTGTFNGGRRLQHALYGLAAVELLRRSYKKAKVDRRCLLLLEPQGATRSG